MAKSTTAKIQIENVLQPGKTYSADSTKYEAMKKAILAVLPKVSPGLTVAEVQERVLAHLPEDLFPGGREIRLVDEGRPARPRSQSGHQAGKDLAGAAVPRLNVAPCPAVACPPRHDWRRMTLGSWPLSTIG